MNKLGYDDALALENTMPPGPYEIRCFLQAPLSQYEIQEIRSRLKESGVILTKISQNGSILSVKALKPEPIQGGIAILPFVAAIGILGGLAISAYAIFALPKIIDAMVPITLIIVLGYVVAKTTPVVFSRK